MLVKWKIQCPEEGWKGKKLDCQRATTIGKGRNADGGQTPGDGHIWELKGGGKKEGEIYHAAFKKRSNFKWRRRNMRPHRSPESGHADFVLIRYVRLYAKAGQGSAEHRQTIRPKFGLAWWNVSWNPARHNALNFEYHFSLFVVTDWAIIACFSLFL